MMVSCGDGLHIGDIGGNCRLAIGIPSPAQYRTVSLERETMMSSGRDGNHIRRIGGNVDLSVEVPSLAEYCTVLRQCQTMKTTRRNCDKTRIRGSRCLIIPVISPPEHGAISLKCQVEIGSGRDGNDISCFGRNGSLTIAVLSPGQQP